MYIPEQKSENHSQMLVDTGPTDPSGTHSIVIK